MVETSKSRLDPSECDRFSFALDIYLMTKHGLPSKEPDYLGCEILHGWFYQLRAVCPTWRFARAAFQWKGRQPKAWVASVPFGKIFWRTSNLRPCNMKRHGNQFFYSANSGISVLVVFGWGMYHFWPLTFGLWDMRVLMYDRRSPLSTSHTT